MSHPYFNQVKGGLLKRMPHLSLGKTVNEAYRPKCVDVTPNSPYDNCANIFTLLFR